MIVRSRKLRQSTLPGFDSAISSQELEGGVVGLRSPDGTRLAGPARHHARTTALRRQSTANEQACKEIAADWLTFGSISLERLSLARSCLKTCQASSRGLPKSRHVWRAMATAFPDKTERLLILAHLISVGECGYLATVTARDWRSPGRSDHPRINASRGLPLPEDFGERITPALACWMMGFPIAWLASAPSETP